MRFSQVTYIGVLRKRYERGKITLSDAYRLMGKLDEWVKQNN